MPEIDEKEFPSNSHKKKVVTVDEKAIVPKKLEPVVSSRVVKKRNSIGNMITQTLFGNDARSVASYVLNDVLVPAAKNTIQEMVSGGIEMLLFGESRGSRNYSRRDRDRTYISYGKFYNRDEQNMLRTKQLRRLAMAKYDDVVIESRDEAEEVLENLIELIENYDVAKLSDFYDLVGMESDFSDEKYGWTNLSRATVSRVRDGYTIILPKPRPID